VRAAIVNRQSPIGSLPALRPDQVEAGRAVLASVYERRGGAISIEISRQGGKNELSAQLELLLLVANALRTADSVKCAPTFDPQARISLRRLWSCVQAAGLERQAAREDGHIVRIGRARQVFLSAEPASNVVGHTAHTLLEVDEAQDVDPEKFDKDFRPMAATTNATAVYYGTAWHETSLLEQVKQMNLTLERKDGIRRHFEYDWETVARYNPAYAAYVLGERERLGERHPLFQTQYCLRTVSGGGRLFDATQRAQLQGRHPRLAFPQAGEYYIAGLDLGGEVSEAVGSGQSAVEAGTARGLPLEEDCLQQPAIANRQSAIRNRHDSTVLTIARSVTPASDALVQEPRLEVVTQYAWQGERHDILYSRLVDLLGAVWDVRRAVVDATGLGEPVARFLVRALGSRILPFRFTAESKSRLGYNLLAAVNGGRLKLYAGDGSPEHRTAWQELERARAVYRPNRTLNFFVAPEEGHDDYLMSLALTVEAAGNWQLRIAKGRAAIAD
jgi:hypothetical protein